MASEPAGGRLRTRGYAPPNIIDRDSSPNARLVNTKDRTARRLTGLLGVIQIASLLAADAEIAAGGEIAHRQHQQDAEPEQSAHDDQFGELIAMADMHEE